MARSRRSKMSDTISNFTFVLFGLLLSLAALAEGPTLKGITIGVCAFASIAAIFRYQIQKLVETYRERAD